MENEMLLTTYLLLDALRDPFTFALLITLTVLAIGYFSRSAGLAFFIAIGTTFGTTHIVKSLAAVPRPESLLTDTSGYRFPSLHAAVAGAFFASLWWYVMLSTKRFWLRALATLTFFSLIAFVSWSRIALGVHLPIDVLVGATIGIVVSVGTHAGIRFFDMKRSVVK